ESVRVATEGDLVRLVELAGQMVGEMAGQRGAAEAARSGWNGPLDDHLAGWLLPPAGHERHAFAGSVDEQVCGFALAHVDPWAEGSRRGVLDACFVEPAARGVGIGRLLLDASLDWLRGHGCTGVDGAALPGDRSAKNFYEGSAFKARLLTMYRPLD
ncbi:MAG TPA: GNAT family N-acetyltransferase, partial [Acidimicrobiales bacterium]|nr:GNAT family N-acetyltransferase [Acidimicrobiales bacterium]